MKMNNNMGKIFYKKDLMEISTAIFSEGMLSVSNFVINILMVRYAVKSEYGLYVILFSLISILATFQRNIINAPLMVLFNNKSESEKVTYISSLAAGNNYLFIPMFLFLAVSGVVYSVANNSASHIIEFSVLFLVTMTYVSKEFVRVCYFVAIDTKAIFRMDLFNVVTTLLGMGLLVYYDAVSCLSGIMVLGAGYLVSYIYAKSKALYSSKRDIESIKEALKENWHYGKWMLVGSGWSLLQDRGYIYIVSAMIGLSALADIFAARLFLVPIGLLNASSCRIAVAKGSKYLSENKSRELRKFIFYFIFSLTVIGVVYCLFILLASNQIIGFLGDKYANTGELIWLWCGYFFIYTIRIQMTTPLLIYKKFKDLAKMDIWGSLLSIVACFVLIFAIGRSGAIISLIVGETVTMVLYMRLFFKIKNEEHP